MKFLIGLVSLLLLSSASVSHAEVKAATAAEVAEQSWKLIDEGKPDEVVSYLNTNLGKIKESEDNKKDLAVAFYNRGAARYDLYMRDSGGAETAAQLEAALADFSRSIELDPGLASAYVFRAMVHLLYERKEAAMTDLNMAIKITPNEPTPHYYRGKLYKEQGKNKEALGDLKMYLAGEARPENDMWRKEAQKMIEEINSSPKS